MKSRYLPVLYVGMALAAFAAGFQYLDRLGRPLTRPATALPAQMPETALSKTALSETTLADIRNSLEKQEYHISFDEQKKKLQSPNRRNNIRAYYEPGKLTVQTRVDTTGKGFKMELLNEGVFADGKLLYTPEITAKAKHHENKVQISHNAFIEEFINNEDGVRQNFIVESAPEGTRQLQVRMTAKGLKVEQGSGNELRFYSESSNGNTRNELVYSDLKCWDANKKPLNATLAYVDKRIQISVDVAAAAYPVTIDPIIANGTPQNANKILEINQSYMWLGFSVSSAGDVNGDGYSDVIVGAPEYDLNQDGEGAAFIYPGTAQGLSLAAVTLQCNQVGAKMGYTVASAGDFNGDGYSDVLVGIPYYDINGQNDGMAKLYFGSAQGIKDNSVPMNFFTGNSGDFCGIALATAGDIDADGYSDIIVGAHSSDFGQKNNQGIALVYYGASANYKTTQQLAADQANAKFGYSVAGAGDVDADGFSDVIIGARYYTNGQGQDGEGAAFIYRGTASGLDTGNPVVIEGDQYDAALGNKVCSAGDVNGDGYSDVLISAYLYDGQYSATQIKDEGRVFLHMGSSTGITAQPVRTFAGGHIDDRLGSSIACAGDVNGDGYSDILLGAQYYDNGQFNEGAVFVCHGSKNGIVGPPASTLESNQADGWFGTAVASAGDVNGDGYSDILIGCYTFDNGQKDEGHVFLYHGGAEGVGTNELTTLSLGSIYGALAGSSVASAGDVNSDGFDDIIMGAPDYDYMGQSGGVALVYYGSLTGINTGNYLILSKNQPGSHFGTSVAGAGDIDGDGYGDIIIGARDYTEGNSKEGIAVIYKGSNSGINPNTSQTLQKDVANAGFGASVSGAGDINRDGFADVIIGSPNFAVGQNIYGAAYIYYGSQNNGATNPVTIQGYDASSSFGNDVSSAGDVNGDGYADVIVGAYSATLGEVQEGAAYIFLGTSGGINTAGKVLQKNQANAWFGTSVASAGDVNADGFGDVIVGAMYYDKNELNEGVAFVYYGNSTGNIDSNPGPSILEANVANARFGSAVQSAGDVNGDGYGDVIIGAKYLSNGNTEEGKAFVFHGSPSGVKPTASFSIEGEQNDIELGTSVAGAGDVNGDGYSDVLVGMPHFNDGGGMHVLYGNNGKGLKNNVRLFNTDLSSPLNYNQFNQPNFVGSLFAKSFIGKNKGKLVWETMGPGVPFSKIGTNPITTSNQFTGAGILANLSSTGSLLGAPIVKTGIATKLRMRVRYSPVLALTGQMYGPWRYLQSQLAGYNNAPVPEEAMAETITHKANPEASRESAVALFPNPVSDRLSIQATNPGDIRSVRLFNTAGKLLYQSPRFEKDIDVSKLPGGVYILMLNRASGTSTSHRVLIRR
ncbi:hypothetical protein J2Y45_005317 [Dyadobacter sp. BE34]|uniref:Secretion system C-terminal sorting domain-containing protein n=1 Tax=Dyadobacter fermentans TaxID=94254 RepID=A0ABU1R4K7_9BACT|nr:MULTISPECIES: FG-GAP-like repeat-containing protein [Dyadobacter]MDR6808333.1 hypothetical protein [Dyadobacter fermentans]MDR7045850.1 hypothetical protein [Dyadobacter sp. BE242]MDR7200163.1 hypothetical protein [Dyadobacter sp. BE34]MDR7218123.1 hypothetical protein [Dyadobacter sp. BE31]MDR7266054.1 hypothetical protein [Dyadobacter sp. BE32]